MTRKMAELPAEEIRIVEFDESDADELSGLMKRVWSSATDYPEDWRVRRMYSPEQIIEEMQAGYHYFGARLSGRIVGVYKAIITDKGLYGEHQTVDDSCRVSGLASAMYMQFAEFGIAHGCVRNYCNILVGQEAGEHLMKKFGFVPWGEPYEQTEGMMVQMYERPLR